MPIIDETVLDTIRRLSKEELLLRIAEGKESYRNGMYELFIEEAQRRHIEPGDTAIAETRDSYVKNPKSNLVIFGYVFSVLGGVIGIMTGIYILAGIKRDSDGNKIHRYDGEVRNHGKTMIALAFFMLLVGWPLIGWLIQMLIYFFAQR
jgi:hypothetical protein